MNREFWSDVLRSGAIIGGVMSISRIFERYMLSFSEIDIMRSSAIYAIEWLVAAVVLIWLLVRYAKRRANAVPVEMGVTYSYVLSFILLTSMLAGVLVGVADTLFISIVGYENYIMGFVGRIDQLQTLYIERGVPVESLTFLDEMSTQMRQVEQPTIFAAVFNLLEIYAAACLIPGFVIAAIVSSRQRRRGAQM